MDARGQPDGDDSNLCYFVAIQEMLHPCMDSVATSVGTFTDAVATPFTGLELGPLLGKARAPSLAPELPRPQLAAAATRGPPARAPVPGPCGRSGRGAAPRAALSAPRLSAESFAGRLRARVPGPVRRVHRRRQGARPRRSRCRSGALAVLCARPSQ